MKKDQVEKQVYHPSTEHTIICTECENTFPLSSLNIATYEGCVNRQLRKDFKCLKVGKNGIVYADRFYKCPCCLRLLPDTTFKLIKRKSE